MSLFNSHTLTVYRKAAGNYVDGYWVPGTEDEFTAKGSVQPLSGYDKQALEEGERARASFYFFTSSKLRTVKQAINGQPAEDADEVLYRNERYEVTREELWDNGIIPHNKYLLMRKDTP